MFGGHFFSCDSIQLDIVRDSGEQMKPMVVGIKYTYRRCKSSSCHQSSCGREHLPGAGSPGVTPHVELGPGGGILHKPQSSTEKVNYWR